LWVSLSLARLLLRLNELYIFLVSSRLLLTLRVFHSILIVERLIARAGRPLGWVRWGTTRSILHLLLALIPVEIVICWLWLLRVVWRYRPLVRIWHLDWSISERGQYLLAGLRSITLALEIR
jgi:hypothetical protein